MTVPPAMLYYFAHPVGNWPGEGILGEQSL
jgi:hypothetical protein